MPKPPPRSGPVPPDFVMAEYLRELAPSLSAPLQLLFSLRTCLQRVNGDLLSWLGSDALSPGRLQMLMLLWAGKGPVRQSDLVRHLGVSRSSVSELVDALAREGLVESVPDPDHGRRLLVALTKPGRLVARAQIENNADRLRASFSGLTLDEQRHLVALLDRLCQTNRGCMPF